MQLYIAGALAIIVFASTAVFFTLRTGTETSPDFETWQSAGGLFSWGEPASVQRPDGTTYRGSGVESLGIIPLPSVAEDAPETFASDLADLLAQLRQPPRPGSEPADFTPSAYSFIPQGLIGLETPRPRTPEQQELYEYGNALGLTFQSFADLHPDTPQTLKDQAEDRGNVAKVAALKRLADDFSQLGDDLAQMSSVPPAAASAHGALAAAYRDVGAKLKKVPDAQGDEAFLATINTYNASAEELSKRLVGLVDLFASRNAMFSSSDPGSIFTFNANSSF